MTSIIAAGLQLVGATTVVVGPLLWLLEPVATTTGPAPKAVDLARRGYRRVIPRSHPAEGYSQPADVPATEGE